MSNVLTFVGSVSIGATIPGVGAALAVSLADLQARVDALLTWSPGEISFAAQLQLAEQLVLQLQSDISLAIVPPSIAAQIAIVAGLLAALRAQLEIILVLQGLMLTAGVDAYAYDGTAAGMGATITTALAAGLPSGGTGATHCNALLLVTQFGPTWAAMGSVFKVTP